MRKALAGVAVALLLATTNTFQAESARAGDGEARNRAEVDLLVPAGSSPDTLRLKSGERAVLGWKRITVPVERSVEETVRGLERELGSAIYLDLAYPLLGGEDEPAFPTQWALENTGQDGGVVDADIDVRAAWKLTAGSGSVVAVIDSGVDDGHPDLDDRIWRNAGETINGIDDDGNGFVDDVAGWDFHANDNDPAPGDTTPDEAHATFIAGIIAAEVNGLGIAGVAHDAQVMNLRACNLGSCLTSHAIAAMEYAVDNGADVINLSFGAPAQEIDLDSPLAQAIEYARQHDVLVVTAAGNTNPADLNPGEVILPAEFPHPNNLAVAASTRDDLIGDESYYGENIDIAAPGFEILSTSLPSFAVGSGTSFSAPHVSAVAALVRSLDSDVSYSVIVAQVLGGVDTPGDIAGKVESGRLNAAGALPRFIDTLGNTFEDDIAWAAESGVTKGCNPPANTLFCPDDDVTRGQMAAFITRFSSLPSASRDHFSDDGDSTFEDDIDRLAEAGITRGCNPPVNDRFCPDDPVTREQMAAFLVRALDLTADNHPGFVDVSADNTFARDIERLATAGITKGCNPPANDMFCPAETVTRDQMAALLHRADD